MIEAPCLRTLPCLRTFWNSYVYLGVDRTLVHIEPSSRAPNFFIPEASGSVLSGDFGLFGIGGRWVLRWERFDDGTLSLRAGDLYVVAVREGTFSLHPERLEKAILTPSTPTARLAVAPRAQGAPTSAADAIPKLIHQTYDEPFPAAPAVAANVEALRSLNPGWSLRLWSDKDRLDFIYEAYGYGVLKAYLRINPRYAAARADLFRYLCIYKWGGVYLDLKSGASAQLDSFIREDDLCLLSQWCDSPVERHRSFGRHPELAHVPGGEFQIWHVIAAPGHAILEQAIDDVLANIRDYHEALDGVGRLATLRVTGPVAYTLAAVKRLGASPHRFFNAEESGLAPYAVSNHRLLFTRNYGRQTTPLVL